MRITITAEEIMLACTGFNTPPAQYERALAEDLSDPAIQRLVVRKCVEGMSEEVFDRLYFQRLSTSPSLAEDRADILAALCPPEQEEG